MFLKDWKTQCKAMLIALIVDIFSIQWCTFFFLLSEQPTSALCQTNVIGYSKYLYGCMIIQYSCQFIWTNVGPTNDR